MAPLRMNQTHKMKILFDVDQFSFSAAVVKEKSLNDCSWPKVANNCSAINVRFGAIAAVIFELVY
jgi:hypothetical protein